MHHQSLALDCTKFGCRSLKIAVFWLVCPCFSRINDLTSGHEKYKLKRIQKSTKNMSSRFIHLRLKSAYSLLESAMKIDTIIYATKKHKMPAVCVTDHNNLFGMLEFAMAAAKAKIQAIHGAIVNMKHHGEVAEILIIAKDKQGYKNLLKLVSHIYTKPDRGQNLEITFEDLKANHEGLIILSAYTNGHVGKSILGHSYDKAREYALELKDLVGDRFYFEIMRHGLGAERKIEKAYIDLAIECDIPLVATNNVLFENIDMHDAHDVLLCIAAGVVKEQQDRPHESNQCYFKSPEEMASLFADLPAAVENSYYIMQRCSVMAKPCEPELPIFTDGDVSEEDMLRLEAKEGLEKRLEKKFIAENIPEEQRETIKSEYFTRIDYELDIICRMKFSGYFLIVSDFIKWSKENDIPVGPGRGSGAGSVVAWSLLITDLDPIKFGLLFERFLNPERVSMPDFDIDFCQERRDEVIQYVRQKYGNNKVGQIITFGKLQAKSVIKDVSRVLGLRYEFADYLTELVPFNAVNPVTLDQAIKEVAELNQASRGEGLYNLHGEEELIKQVLETALILEGLCRHVSVHAAGIVIGSRELLDILPLYKDANSDMLIIQYSMKYAEAAGLVKFDFLGLQTLTLIDKCAQLIRKNGTEIDPNNLPYNDPKTFALLTTGQSSGVFQFESVGMKDALRKLRPDCIEDIISLGALYRPGPMDNIPTYIACKHGREQPNYLHPTLEKTLKETYGVIIYQEQVMEIAQILAGYTLGAADLLRRAMGKKIKAEMAAQEKMFVEGAQAKGISKSQASSIFELVAKFAGYGFNKAHAAAYGVISYQTAYLKANFTAEFLTTCLNLDMHDSDKVNLFVNEALAFGIGIVPPDVNESRGAFYLRRDPQVGDAKIIYALGAIKGITPVLGNTIAVEADKKHFSTPLDLVERMPPRALNRKGLENLIKAGAFDHLHANRNELLISISKLMSHATSHHSQIQQQQSSLFGVDIKHVIDKAEDLGPLEKAMMEFEVCGVFLREHPVAAYNELLQLSGATNSYQIKNEMQNGSARIDIAGVIQKKDSRMSQRGRFVTIQLSDQFGNFEVTIYNEETFKKYADMLDLKMMVVVTCDMFKDEGGIRLTASGFQDVKKYLIGGGHELVFYPKNELELEGLVKLLAAKAQKGEEPNTKVFIYYPSEGNMLAKIAFPDQSFDLRDVAELRSMERVEGV